MNVFLSCVRGGIGGGALACCCGGRIGVNMRPGLAYDCSCVGINGGGRGGRNVP